MCHEEVELLATGGATGGGGGGGGCEGRRARGDLRVDAGELVHGGGDAEAGDVRLEQALVERVRRDDAGELLGLGDDAAAEDGSMARPWSG